MKTKKYESGQALIFIVAAIIGLVAMTGLTVDGGMTYVDRQNAQSSADSAALGAALAKIRGQNITTTALSIAATNGYINDTTHDTITVTNPITTATTGCDGQAIRSEYRTANYVHVKIVTNVNAYFAPIVGVRQTHNCVEAIAKAQLATVVPLFDGNAVVGLNPNTPCAFDSGQSNSVKWILTGGGLLSYGCAYSKNSTSVTLDTNKCVTTVDGATGGLSSKACTSPPTPVYTAAEIIAMMPPNPCTGTPSGGTYPNGGKVVTAGQLTFSNGVYCMDTEAKMNALGGHIVQLTNATLYVTATQFDVNFQGGGQTGTGFSGTAPTSGVYAGYYMVIAANNSPCVDYNGNKTGKQILEYKGNGNADLVGTIFAPTACIDFRGNAEAEKTESQVIGYTVTSNGTADLEINYDETKNGKRTIQASVELTK